MNITVKVDMELYASHNHPIANFVGALYAVFDQFIKDNRNGPSHDVQIKVEGAFREALTAVQCMSYDGPKFGYPGQAENPFEILSRNAKAADIEGVISRLITEMKTMMKIDGFDVIYHELREEHNLKMVRTIIKPCCLSVTNILRENLTPEA